VDGHRFVVAIATAALVGVVAACGGSAASPTTPPTEAPTEAPVPTGSAAATEAPSDAAATPTIAARTTAAAKCTGVALRKEPSTTGKVIVRARAGTKVRVVETVPGDAYEAGSCGTAGDTWLKVDRVGGKSIQTLYGVPFGFVAAGFFE